MPGKCGVSLTSDDTRVMHGGSACHRSTYTRSLFMRSRSDLAGVALAALCLLAASTRAVCAQAHVPTAADSAAIKATALDYIEGWYTGDAERMERALHPELAKRIVYQ